MTDGTLPVQPTDRDLRPWLRDLGLPMPTVTSSTLSGAERNRMESSLERRQHFLHRLGGHGITFTGEEDVLDVGCGRGASTVALAHRVARVIGIDVTYSPRLAAQALNTYGLSNAAVYAYGLINSHYAAPDFPVRGSTFDVIFSYRGIGRLDLWDGAARIHDLLVSGGRTIVLYPHFWYPQAPLSEWERRLASYAERRFPDWSEQTLDALQRRWRHAGLRLHGIVDPEFPPVHARSYILELIGPNESRWTVSRHLNLTSTTMVPTALLLAER